MSSARNLLVLILLAALCVAPVPAAAAKPNPHAELECAYCHEDSPLFGVDTRETVTFWRAEGDEPRLCQRCHGPAANLHPLGAVPGPDRLGTRQPERLPLGKTEAVRDQVVCTSCHFLHAANADFALLRGFPGSDNPGLFAAWQDLCRECHGTGLERISPHAGDERSCGICHVVQPQPGKPGAITAKGRKLCEFCHGQKGARHYADVTPVPAPQECLDCHEPHLGKDHPGRLKPGYFEPFRDSVTMDPHGRRTRCFACHPDAGGKTLLTADPTALCQRCHGSGKITGMSHPLGKVPAGYAVPAAWPLTAGTLTCLTCHRPGHATDQTTPSLLRATSEERNAVCFVCHPATQWDGIDPHAEAVKSRTGCARCHLKEPVPGKDDARSVTFVAGVNILCLSCHNAVPHPGGVRHTLTLGQTSSRAIPADFPLAPGRQMTCATCHNPHLEPSSGHLVRGTEETGAFCARCHSF